VIEPSAATVTPIRSAGRSSSPSRADILMLSRVAECETTRTRGNRLLSRSSASHRWTQTSDPLAPGGPRCWGVRGGGSGLAGISRFFGMVIRMYFDDPLR
jgi:hypothetical protein